MVRTGITIVLIFQLSFWGVQYIQEQKVLAGTGSGERSVSADTKGDSWHLPVEKPEREEAEEDCRKISDSMAAVFGKSVSGEINGENGGEALDVLKDSGCPAFFSGSGMNMKNHGKMERFLEQSQQGMPGEIIVFELCSDGGVWRNKFRFDGQEMIVFQTRTTWTGDAAKLSETECTRIREWSYTEKGWFIYELCVPQPPQVSECVNGNCMIRVKPLKSRYRKTADQYLCPIGYQGNNLFCSDWDEEHLEKLDYTGLYERFYFMKHRERYNGRQHPDGIPKKEFENLIQEYLPVTTEQIRSCAAFDKKEKTYLWNRLGCLNYTPTAFDTSVPEITEMRENDDGTTAITIDAVCARRGNERVMSHVLTVRLDRGGGVQYLSNRILEDGEEKVPAYQRRVKNNYEK